ncbi:MULTISPECIES: hypothetical protein [Vibrio]|uniref:hypothetical protein n=1 Tax=Vibrio TaxID=662 RepID=UPI001E50F8B5|nr:MULTISPECIES: hypothetical protein [Vibrio]
MHKNAAFLKLESANTIKKLEKLTIMVNNQRNVSAFEQDPPTSTTTGRINIVGPLYEKEVVLKILESEGNTPIPWTRQCKTDIQNLALDTDDINELLKQAIKQGQYLKSEWCVQKPTGPWAACDSYRLQREEWIEYAYKYISCNYYVKFAIGKTGKILLLVSCHVSQ